MGEIILELVVLFWQRKTILSHFVFFFKIVKILQLCGRKQIAKIHKFSCLCDCLVCVIFLFIFLISQIWEFVYISNMLYFACNNRYLVWFSSAYTSHKEKGLSWKKRMEARIVILIRKALLQSSMSKLKIISNALMNCIFNKCNLSLYSFTLTFLKIRYWSYHVGRCVHRSV